MNKDKKEWDGYKCIYCNGNYHTPYHFCKQAPAVIPISSAPDSATDHQNQ